MNQYDHLETYCRSLGDCIHFSYCRAAGGTLPCSRIVDCWIGRIPVLEYLQQHYSAEELKRVFAPQPGRIERLLKIAEKVMEKSST